MNTERENMCTELEETTEVKYPNDRESDILEDAATPDGSRLVESDTDDSWERQLDTFKQKIEELQGEYDKSFLEIGRVLIQARDTYKGHGDWIKWLKGNVPFSVRHAQRLIRVAELFDGDNATLVSRLGLTSSKAFILTKVSEKDISHFLGMFFLVGDKRKSIKEMTKRELELVVKKFLKEKLASTDHEERVTTGKDRGTLKESVESNLEELKKVLNKTIASIKGSDSDTRESWITELEELCRTGLDQLISASE